MAGMLQLITYTELPEKSCSYCWQDMACGNQAASKGDPPACGGLSLQCPCCSWEGYGI